MVYNKIKVTIKVKGSDGDGDGDGDGDSDGESDGFLPGTRRIWFRPLQVCTRIVQCRDHSYCPVNLVDHTDNLNSGSSRDSLIE